MTFKDILKQRARKSVAPKAIDKVWPYGILLAPVFTEKTYQKQEEENKYVFKVHPDANKNDVALAIKYIYKITPVKINMLNTAFKNKSKKPLVKKSYKKAIITLSEKEKIEFAV